MLLLLLLASGISTLFVVLLWATNSVYQPFFGNWIKIFKRILLASGISAVFVVLLWATVGSKIDLTTGTTPGNPSAGKVRLWANSGSGNIECLNSSGNPCIGSGLALVEQHTASSSAELDFTTCISSTYDEYEVHINQLTPATNSVNLELQFSTNGGSSYDATSGHYAWASYGFSNTGAGSSGNQSTTYIDMGGNPVYNGSTQAVGGTYHLYNSGSGSKYPVIQGSNLVPKASDQTAQPAEGNFPVGVYLQTTAVNAFRILFSSGNIASGITRCYGVAKQ